MPDEDEIDSRSNGLPTLKEGNRPQTIRGPDACIVELLVTRRRFGVDVADPVNDGTKFETLTFVLAFGCGRIGRRIDGVIGIADWVLRQTRKSSVDHE